MEEEKKEAVNETSESVNEEKKEKKDVKVIINQFVEKHGKKNCIIYASICGAVILALVLGLGLGLGLNKKAPIVDAETWKARADEIQTKHDDSDSGYVAPTKATVKLGYGYKKDYSDGVIDDDYKTVTWKYDYDNLIVAGQSNSGHKYSGDLEKINYHCSDNESYDIDNEYYFWADLDEKKAYIVASQDSVTKSMYFLITDEEIASLKANPELMLSELNDNCASAFEKQLQKLGDESLNNFEWAYPEYPLSEMTIMASPKDYYEQYYDVLMEKGSIYMGGDLLFADYTMEKLDLRSSGSGNLSFEFVGTADKDQEYTEAVKDMVKHISGKSSAELAYDNYNMTYFGVDRKATVDLTGDCACDVTFNQYYEMNYSKVKISKPSVVNLINGME